MLNFTFLIKTSFAAVTASLPKGLLCWLGNVPKLSSAASHTPARLGLDLLIELAKPQ